MIYANSETRAQRAANLIHNARLLLEGSTVFSQIASGEYAPIRPAKGTAPYRPEEDDLEFKLPHVVTPNIPLACLIAARASWRLQYVYALSKLGLSFETFSLPFIELDPHHSQNVPKSPLPEEHVRLAFAIVTAWSCIEELGFDIRASQKNPSKLPNGNWNPIIKNDLEVRLRLGHVDLKEQFYWNLRGARTRIERKRAPELIDKASWARYPVRDGKMEVIDALLYVSFLRSWVAAHSSDKRLIKVLSVYDVANSQFLARRLFLERMGFWRYRGE